MWVNYQLVDVEVDDGNTGIFHVFELRIGMNEFDHRSFFITATCQPRLTQNVPAENHTSERIHNMDIKFFNRNNYPVLSILLQRTFCKRIELQT